MEMSGQLHAPAALFQKMRFHYPLDWRLGGPQSRSERCKVQENLLPLPTAEPRPAARRYTDWAIPVTTPNKYLC
jgi:hypothetical protein